MPHKPTLFTLRHKLSLANDAIDRIKSQLRFVQALRTSIDTQINTIIINQPPHAQLYAEFESATRTFENNYWINLCDFHTRRNDPTITSSQLTLLESDIYHFNETEARIPPERNEYSLYNVYPSPPSSPDSSPPSSPEHN